MVELRIVEGDLAGETVAVSYFPWVIGRSSKADLCLQDTGVWDGHLQLELDPLMGFRCSVLGEARVVLNGTPLTHAWLRNGDEIQLGAAKLQFWLSETQQKSLTAREVLTWIGLGGLAVSQVFLIYRLVIS